MEESTYLLELYVAEHERSPPIASGHLADRLDRSPAATTEMLQRLESRGLVTHEPYEGATLTPAGRERAVDRYETYTTLAEFFREVLELDAYEQEAKKLAGFVSPTVANRLRATLLGDGTPQDAPD